MRNIIAAVALATIISSPAFAQSYDPDLGSGNVTAHVTAPAARSTLDWGAYGAHAQVRHGAAAAGRSFNRSRSITDPDPNIRFQLNREAEQGRW